MLNAHIIFRWGSEVNAMRNDGRLRAVSSSLVVRLKLCSTVVDSLFSDCGNLPTDLPVLRLDLAGVAMKVAVIGAGVVGLSTAYCLVEKLGDAGVSVKIIADKFSPNTTSDQAGAFAQPVVFHHQARKKAEYDARLQQWTLDTFKHFSSLYHTPAAADIELNLVSGYKLVNSATPPPWWKELHLGFRCIPADSPEVRALIQQPNSHHSLSVWAFSSYVVDCRHYLPWLMDGFVRKGGMVQQRRLKSLDELRGYDIVVNCTGLGAAELVGDHDLHPVGGQAVLVKAPWIKHFVINVENKDEITYILPRSRDVLLGGTAVSGNWSETVDPATSEAIVSRCAALLPSLRGAEVIGAWVGGRPVRKTVRLEKEEKGSGQPLLIHNYGHGGQGIILHWGCALEVRRIVEQFISPRL